MNLRIEWLSDGNASAIGPVGLALHKSWEQEVNPGDPPVGLGEFVAVRSRASSNKRSATAVGFLGDEGVAIAECNLMLGVNSHLVVVRVLHVAASRRRQGVGSKMLRTVATSAGALGYSSLSVWAAGEAETAFCEHHHLTHQTTERHSRLDIDDVNAAEQAVWAAGERAASAGYKVVRVPPFCPPELVDTVCLCYDAEQDLPLGDLDYSLQTLDHDGLRSSEADLRSAGLAAYRTIALSPDGTGAGITELGVNTHRPQLGIQGTTAVVPQHRGLRIGRWLKAVNLRDARAGHPQLRSIDTTNAEANPWMLDINIGMGFQAHHTSLLYGCSITHLIT